MTEEDLIARLGAGEGPLCEWKASAKSDEIREAVVAFANTVRAPNVVVLYLGVNPDGTPSGNITDADKTQRDAARYLGSCYPRILGVELYPLSVGGRNVIAIVVSESRNGPHFTGPAYVRVGSQSRLASAQAFDAVITDRTEPARLLRPWIGQQIQVQREYEPIRGRRAWQDGISGMRLLRVDAVGLALEVGGAAPVVADWGRVRLQPFEAGQVPLVRISLD